MTVWPTLALFITFVEDQPFYSQEFFIPVVGSVQSVVEVVEKIVMPIRSGDSDVEAGADRPIGTLEPLPLWIVGELSVGFVELVLLVIIS